MSATNPGEGSPEWFARFVRRIALNMLISPVRARGTRGDSVGSIKPRPTIRTIEVIRATLHTRVFAAGEAAELAPSAKILYGFPLVDHAVIVDRAFPAEPGSTTCDRM